MSFVRLAVLAVLYAAAACVVAWSVGMMAVAGVPVVAALVLKAVLVALVLVVVTWRGSGGELTGQRQVLLVAIAGAVGFALNPFTWAARTFVGQLLGADGTVALVVDLTAWSVVVVATAWTAMRRRATTKVAYA